MEYHLVTCNSNHSRCNISIFIINIKFRQLLLRYHCSVKLSLSGRDNDSNRFQPARELFLTQTQTYLHQGSLRLPLVQLRNQLRRSDQRRTLRDSTSLPGSLGLACNGLTPLAPRTSLLPLVCTLSLTRSRPELSYSASWSERLIRPTKC